MNIIKNKIRKVSNERNRSLILPIPASIRDIMGFEDGTDITWKIHQIDSEKCVILKKSVEK